MWSGLRWQEYPPEKLLAERFRIFTGFHPGQYDIIKQLVQGQRVLAIQRTGWGKSLCYQMASLYYPHLTIIFSPLKALMRDQCQRCNDVYAIPSAIVSSDFSEDENKVTLEQAAAGNFKLLFIAPERLDNLHWQTYVPRMRISMIVIDEAHCISTWGHDFRPHYRRIVRLLTALPKNTPVLALTATANKRVEQDVLGQMGEVALVIRGTMQRSNLHLNVIGLEGDPGKLCYLAEVLPRWPGTGIIYTATRANAEMVAEFLAKQGIVAVYYHAGIEDDVRQDIEQKWMSNQYKVVCSTNALGMGIDKPDIRFVVHYNIPASPIHYYQEIGRAGRDGYAAKCTLLYDPVDLEVQEHFIQNGRPKAAYYREVWSLLQTMPAGMHDIMRASGYAQKTVQTILIDLEEKQIIERNTRTREYSVVGRLEQADLATYDIVQQQKQCELLDIQNYATTKECYMGYLTAYLGDQPGYHCGSCRHCLPENFPFVAPSERTQKAVAQFLEKDFLPVIEKRGTERRPIHEAGWSLSYHGKSRIGQLVRASKYEDAGPFALGLVYHAVELVRTRYPMQAIDGIVSVPPTKSGLLVETFARQVAAQLGIEYLAVIAKVRPTQEQKKLSNWLQKVDNVKGAFSILSPELIAGRTLLLIDDIYDSGYMLREVGQTLMQAGAKAVYPLTITRTAHSDDQ